MKKYKIFHWSRQAVTYLIDFEKLKEERLNKFIKDIVNENPFEIKSKEDKLELVLKQITCDIFRTVTYDNDEKFIISEMTCISDFIKLDGSEGITLDYVDTFNYYVEDCWLKIITEE